MRYVTLECRLDRETGEHGLVTRGTPDLDMPMVDTSGLLIAHDLIEHQNGQREIGTIGDELEALGAIWYVRGQWGDITRGHSIHKAETHIASDLTRMCVEYCNGAGFHRPVPRTKPCDYDEAFQTCIDISLSEIKGGIDIEDRDLPTIARYYDAALHYMRAGIRKAHKRYARIGGALAANNMFWMIKEAVEPYAKHAEFEGQLYRLAYSRNHATCEEAYDNE